jgi:hypothetical protein
MRLLPIPAALLLAAGSAAGDSTIDPAKHHAWSPDSGWLDFRPSAALGVDVGEAFLSGYAWSPNFGWLHLGDGTPVNGHGYSNTGGDYGVNHDGAGALSGNAWGANIGWVRFDWASPGDPNAPRINLSSGDFAGYAWSPNTGWLRLGSGRLATDAISSPDSDGDNIADAWEWENFGNLTTAGIGTDQDRDGRSDASEYGADTDPNDPASFLRIVDQAYNGALTTVIIEFSSSPSRHYRVEYDDDLSGPWTNSSLGTFSPDPGATTTRLVAFPTGSARFFRAVAVRPLAP